MRSAILLLGAATMAACAPAQGDPKRSPSVGRWKAGSFTHVNAVCRQSWVCERPPGIYPAGCKSTPMQYTTGTCSADGGPIDSCNTCIAGDPKVACETTCPVDK